MNRENNYLFQEWPKYKEPCNTCMFRMTPQDSPFCSTCWYTCKHENVKIVDDILVCEECGDCREVTTKDIKADGTVFIKTNTGNITINHNR